MKNDWHNNLISKKLDEEYPHDFSICDIDGACRVFYKHEGNYKSRLVIYESKHLNEPIHQTQLQTLFEISDNMNWENFDKQSGVFVIRHDNNVWNLKVHKIKKAVGYGRPLFECQLIKEMTFDNFYNWISAADKRIDKKVYVSPNLSSNL